MKKRHSEEQISRILRESELHEVPIWDLDKQHDVLASHCPARRVATGQPCALTHMPLRRTIRRSVRTSIRANIQFLLTKAYGRLP